ncbi:hypothetical protein ACRALDRAFT_1095179 [Sodiomyces alcalophilus JCM 7366]|uniref:uncharacterized protein n=1 Tax=Sodiomyces alcalophilus JCM 7366 TaxID=591952 RepID=UPI0039B56D4B
MNVYVVEMETLTDSGCVSLHLRPVLRHAPPVSNQKLLLFRFLPFPFRLSASLVPSNAPESNALTKQMKEDKEILRKMLMLFFEKKVEMMDDGECDDDQGAKVSSSSVATDSAHPRHSKNAFTCRPLSFFSVFFSSSLSLSPLPNSRLSFSRYLGRISPINVAKDSLNLISTES